jgi:3-hydroxyacyl-CoA dehydrogenase/enoyl-CoA hydratase/3-hydroxybutyryl-CoA epimerase/3-hydroxyacyl-CoA dehydrogenase/enoyl-CoA hydratase/3-hydroxybutyryl-CoA epimerase/enoyl-CoA isomerase
MSQGALRLDVLDGQIGQLTIDQPGSRANTLGQAVLAELAAIVKDLSARTDLKGLILRSGKPGMFIAGADLKELGAARSDPEQHRHLVRYGLNILAAFEALPYPTVAAIEGSCMGGGLEVALAFDFRIASTHPKTEIGLPETSVGLIPGWGGTQRLTRLIGPSLAAELICAGEAVKALKAAQLGIVFDAVPPERLLEEALRLLRWAQDSGAWHDARKKKQQPVGLTEEQLGFGAGVARAQVLGKTKGHYPAPLAALDAIFKGCNLPLDEGLKFETDAFVPLVGSSVSRNLIALFFTRTRLQKDTGVVDPKVQPRDVKQIGVIGAGLMGSGIAGANIRRGVPVLMMDAIPAAVERGVAINTKIMRDRIGIGRMTPEELAASLARLSTTTTLAGFGDRDVVVEAVVENEETKVRTYKQVQEIIAPDAILASNTSTISISRMARSVKNPARFAGMHFFNPVDRMQLVEVIRGEQTSDQTVVTLVALAKRIGKTPIVVRDCPGFLVNRILFPYLNESLLMLEEGAPPRDLDKAATAFGMPMGPILLHDVVGMDTSLFAGRVIGTAFADRAVMPKIVEELVKAGRLGQKSGAGFYSYVKSPKGADDPALIEILARVRKQTRSLTQQEITDRMFLPMLVEASRVLTENIVREPGDLDMGLILGIGFPSFHGGILRWADEQSLPRVLEKLARYESLGARFHPTEQMRKLAAANRGFYS